MRNYDSSTEMWHLGRISTFSDQNPGQGEGNVGEGNTGNVTIPAETPPQNQGTNWEAAYKTLQRTNTNLQNKIDTLESQNNQLTSNLASRASEVQNLQSSLETVNSQITEWQTKFEEVDGKVGNLNAQLERQNLIMGEFPHLAKFEADGLLPAADTPEAMRETFAKFSKALGDIKDGAVTQLLDGASPEPVGGENDGDGKSVSLTADQAYAKVVELSKGNDRQAYSVAYEEYLELLKQEEGEKAVSGYQE
jgi:hypothetical protein